MCHVEVVFSGDSLLVTPHKSSQFLWPRFSPGPNPLGVLRRRSATTLWRFLLGRLPWGKQVSLSRRTVPGPSQVELPHRGCTPCKGCPIGRHERAVVRRRRSFRPQAVARRHRSPPDRQSRSAPSAGLWGRVPPALNAFCWALARVQRSCAAYIARHTFMYASWRLGSFTAPLKLLQFKPIT